MTKKDYELIARAIQRVITDTPAAKDIKANIVMSIASALAIDNPAFQSHKFRTACGTGGQS